MQGVGERSNLWRIKPSGLFHTFVLSLCDLFSYDRSNCYLFVACRVNKKKQENVRILVIHLEIKLKTCHGSWAIFKRGKDFDIFSGLFSCTLSG